MTSWQGFQSCSPVNAVGPTGTDGISPEPDLELRTTAQMAPSPRVPMMLKVLRERAGVKRHIQKCKNRGTDNRVHGSIRSALSGI